MKSCVYCGKQYSDEVVICPVDGQPAVDKEADRRKGPPEPPADSTAFSLTLISPIAAAGTYRVIVEHNDLLFIQISGGSKSVLAALALLVGPAGGLIHLVSWLFTRKQANDRRKKIEHQKPDDLLRENEHHFKLYLAEIRDAAIEPATFLSASGKAGRLILTVRHGEKNKFEFESAAEMNNAIHLLSPLLNSTLSINVEWNEKKRRFQKKTRK